MAYTPKTFHSLLDWVTKTLPNAIISEDMDGQLIIHTNMVCGEDDVIREFCPESTERPLNESEDLL